MDASLQTQAERLAGQFANQAKTAEDLNDLMRLMMKSALERMLDAEMDVHLGRTKLGSETASNAEAEFSENPVSTEASAASSAKRSPNRRNGRSRKTVRGDVGDLTISTPHDRDGTFEPRPTPRVGARSARTSGACRASTRRFSPCTPKE